MKRFLTGIEAQLDRDAEAISEALRALRALREIHIHEAFALRRRRRRGEDIEVAEINDHVFAAREVNQTIIKLLTTRRHMHSLQYDILSEAI